MEIGFIQYDPDPKGRMKKFLVPNSDENGITGISSATVHLPINDQSKDFLKRVFPDLRENGQELSVTLKNGNLRFVHAESVYVELYADVNADHLRGRRFTLENVAVQT